MTTIDQNMLRSRQTHLNASIVAGELRRDMIPTLFRFAVLLAGLAGLAFALGGV